MNFKSFPLLLLATLISFFCQAGAAEYDQLKVAKIDIIAENVPQSSNFDPLSVRASLKTKIGGLFSQTEFDNDLKALAEDYDRVEPAIQLINGELYITLRVWIRPTIRSIGYLGNERVKTKKLQKQLGVKAGEIFDREAFIQGLNKIKLFYVKKGYFEASVSYEIASSQNGCEIDITINIDEGRAGKIKDILFTGLDPCEEDDLLDMIATKRFNFLLSWYTGRGVYHPDMIEHDQMVIISYLQDLGYADAQVNIYTEECPQDGRIILHIDVDKGVIYNFGALTICGNTIFSNEEIYGQFKFWRGGHYSPELIRNTIQAIRNLYGACGYIDAACDIQLQLHEGCPIYDVNVEIDEGSQYYVGMIRVFGNTCTQTRVILHECLLCPGEVFDIRKIEATEARLQNTGYFCNVNVYAVKNFDTEDQDPCYRDVYIEVEETDTGNIGLFFGFSSLDNLFGGIDFSEQNFNIAGIGSLLTGGGGSLRGGGEYLHMKANLGTRQTSYLLQWTKPYFMDTPWILGVDLEKSDNRAYSRGYTIKTYGGNVHGTRILNDFVKYDMHYRAKHTRVDVRDKNANYALQDEGQDHGFISAVGNTLIYDSTDSPRRPTRGFRSRLAYELAGVGGNFQFMRFSYYNTYYYPVSKKSVLKFRADINFIHAYGHTSANDVPLSERLFLGGETTVRGYRNYIIGPLFANNEPAGGVSSYLLSEEYQYNLLRAPCIDAFVFMDAGYVSPTEFTVGAPAASTGFGLRFEIMRNMPMMVGLGFPIHPNVEFRRSIDGQKVKFETTQRFFFSMGGCF